MKLTGRCIIDIQSSFIHFEAEEYIDEDIKKLIREEGVEQYWEGEHPPFKKCILIGFDDLTEEQERLIQHEIKGSNDITNEVFDDMHRFMNEIIL